MPGMAGRLVMDRPEKLIVRMGRVLIAGKSPPPADRLRPNLCGPPQRAASGEGAWSCSEGGALRGLSCRAFVGAPLRRDRFSGRGFGRAKVALLQGRAWLLSQCFNRAPRAASPRLSHRQLRDRASLRSRDPCTERARIAGLFVAAGGREAGQSPFLGLATLSLFSVNRMINARRSSVL